MRAGPQRGGGPVPAAAPLAAVLVLLALPLLALCGDVTRDNATMVWVHAAPLTGASAHLGLSALAGVRSAFADANVYSNVKFVVASHDDAGDPALARAQVRDALLGDAGVFGVMGVVGGACAEAAAGAAYELGAPFVGALAGPKALYTSDGLARRVVNVRASRADEIEALITYLATDWSLFESTSVLCCNDTDGLEVAQAFGGALATVGVRVLSRAAYAQPPRAGDRELVASVRSALRELRLAAQGTSRAVSAAAYVSACELRRSDVVLATLSDADAEEVAARLALDSEAANCSELLDVLVLSSQVVPVPTNRGNPVVLEYNRSIAKNFPNSSEPTHAGLEAYIAGRFIADVAFRALSLYGFPLSWANFVRVINDSQTFPISGFSLGPYSSTCAQGSHEVFVTGTTGGLLPRPVRNGILKFSTCGIGKWTRDGGRWLIGQSFASAGPLSAVGYGLRIGAAGAISQHNSKTDLELPLLLGTLSDRDNITLAYENCGKLLRAGALAMFGTIGTEDTAGCLSALRDSEVALFAPLSGAQSIRFPFQRNVVNLYASYHQEAEVMVEFLVGRLNSTRIAVLYQEDDFGLDGLAGVVAAIKRKGRHVSLVLSASYRRGTTYVKPAHRSIESVKPHAVIAFATAEAVAAFASLSAGSALEGTPLVSSSASGTEVLEQALAGLHVKLPSAGLFQTQLLPPLTGQRYQIFTDFQFWVSNDKTESSSFQGYFSARFLSEVMRRIPRGTTPTPKALVDAVYTGRVFDIGGISVGPFVEHCTRAEPCCNQGLDLVFVTQLDPHSRLFNPVEGFSHKLARCGIQPEADASSGSPTPSIIRVLFVAAGVLGFIVFVCLMCLFIIFLSKMKNKGEMFIPRKELELMDELGSGHMGTVYLALWRGTEVAVRVMPIAQTDVEALATLRAEAALMRSLRHPNCHMIMGFSETDADFILYMPMGSLQSVLSNDMLPLDFNLLMGIAYDVLKGMTFLHAQRLPIIHSNLSSLSILLDSKLSAKVSDWWFHAPLGKGSKSSNSWHQQSMWLAPELIAGMRPVLATDIYAFGVVLWELLLPRETYMQMAVSSQDSESGGARRQSNAFPHPDIPEDVPKALQELLLSCWSTQPKHRPPFATILARWPEIFAETGLQFEAPPPETLLIDPSQQSNLIMLGGSWSASLPRDTPKPAPVRAPSHFQGSFQSPVGSGSIQSSLGLVGSQMQLVMPPPAKSASPMAYPVGSITLLNSFIPPSFVMANAASPVFEADSLTQPLLFGVVPPEEPQMPQSHRSEPSIPLWQNPK
eukprot:m51a1_g3266 putative serine threonine kinase (1283) ;mRNA; r:202184-206895